MVMGHDRNPGYIPGDHWNTCQRCGFDIRNSETLQEWNGLKVCKQCWEPRHPLDFVRTLPDDTQAKGLVTGDINRTDYITEQDNTSPTLTAGTDSELQTWNTALTANRTITLVGSLDGQRFSIYRTAGGAYTLDVGGVYTIPASINMLVEVEYFNGNWRLVATTHLD